MRVVEALPTTETNKILKRWECDDPVWWRPEGDAYRRLCAADAAALRRHFEERGRVALLDT